MQLQGLTRIIQSFKPAECDFIREYYLKRNNGSATKRLQLFDLLNNRLVKDNEQVCRLLYNRKPDSGFSQLKKRLKEDLLDFLIFFPSNRGEQGSAEIVELECRRLFIQAKTLVYKGIPDEAVGILKKVQKTALDNDLPGMKALALELLQEISGQSFDEFGTYSSRVERDLETHLLIVKARNLYKRLNEEESLNLIQSEDRTFLDDLQLNNLAGDSPGIQYWYELLMIKVKRLEQNIVRAYYHGLRLQRVLEDKTMVFSKGRQFDFYLEMAQLLYKAGKFKKAELFACKAKMLCNTNCPDLLKVLEIRFLLHFSNGNFDSCNSLLSEALDHDELQSQENTYHKWRFFEACLLFKDGNYKGSLSLLRKSGNLEKDRSGFFIEQRLLELLNLIETEDHDLLEYRVESFRKLIDYHKDKCPEHAHHVMRILRSFVRTDFDLESTCQIEYVSVQALGQPHSFSGLIDVNSWLSSRLSGREVRLVG